MLDTLSAACDRGIASSPGELIEDHDSRVSVCEDAQEWIECGEKSPEDAFKTCPADKDVWRARMDKLATMVFNLSGETPYYWLTIAPAALESSRQASEDVATAKLSSYLKEKKPLLDFSLAKFLAMRSSAGNPMIYNGVNVADYLKNYQSTPRYNYMADDIIVGLRFAWRHDFISDDRLRAFYRQLQYDETLTVRARLDAERTSYQVGLLPVE